MALYTCRPDRYMTAAEMSALFNDFDLSLKTGHSSAAIFSSLVNNVRHVYMTALLETREEQHDEYKEHARELAALKSERGDERKSPAQYGSGLPERTTTSSPPDQAAVRFPGAAVEIGQAQERKITWPAITYPLHIGTYTEGWRRDLCDWKEMNGHAFTERLVFNAFKFEEPGTFKVTVQRSQASCGGTQILANREPCSKDGWKFLLEFYAYGEQRPGTHEIWVAYNSKPERCIFLKGDRTDILPGWERMFQFWVPE